MDQEERRLAMLRMRGELPLEEEEEKEVPRTQKSGNKKKKGNHPKKRSLMSHKEIMRRRRQLQAIARLILYLAAFIVLVLVVVTAFKSCRQGGNEPGMENKTRAQIEQGGADSRETTVQAPEETTAAPVKDVTDAPKETQGPEHTTEEAVAVNAGIPVDISHIVIPDWIEQDFLPINDMSRPGTKLEKIKYIAIHWVGNPNTSAKANRNYFESLAETKERKASSQFVVGLEGEVIQCMPLDELAYAVKDKYNPITISIEVCHPDAEGKFSDITYQSVIKLTAWLMQQFDLEKDAIIRHYDCTKKDCPKYYVEHEDAWNQLKNDVMDYKKRNPNIS